MTDDLIAWLRAQLDDDERVARAVADHRGRPGELRWTQTDPDRTPGLIGDECGNVVTYDEGSPNEQQAEHIARHDPARVLAEVDAKRRILDLAEMVLDTANDRRHDADGVALSQPIARRRMRDLVKLLALPHAGRPGYRSEWAVTE